MPPSGHHDHDVKAEDNRDRDEEIAQITTVPAHAVENVFTGGVLVKDKPVEDQQDIIGKDEHAEIPYDHLVETALPAKQKFHESPKASFTHILAINYSHFRAPLLKPPDAKSEQA